MNINSARTLLKELKRIQFSTEEKPHLRKGTNIRISIKLEDLDRIVDELCAKFPE
jgi:hypothetical protein